MSGRSKDRPELAASVIPLEVSIPVLPSRGGEALIRELFEPLGYTVNAERMPLDEKFPSWGESRYFAVTLQGTLRLQDLSRAPVRAHPGARRREALLGRRR